jgi:hypothetical protein
MAANTNINTNNPYTNADGLMVRYGTKEAVVEKVGDLNTYGDEKMMKLKVLWSDLTLAVDATHNFVLSYQNVLPKNSVVTKVEFHVVTAWDSASNDVALNFGVLREADMEIIDADGLMDTVPKTALDTAGAIVSVYKGDSLPAAATYVGAELGSARPTNQYVSAFWENNTPTVGEGILYVYYRGA